MDYMRGEKDKDSMVLIDEMWTILSSKCSMSIKNRIVSNVLLRSRKRGLNYTFTTQLLSLVDKSLRNIIDFTNYPMMNPDETMLKLIIFKGSIPKIANILKTIYIPTEFVFRLYDTREEVQIKEKSNKKDIIIFQESPDHEMEFFKTWEEADKRGEEFWKKNRNLLNGIVS